MYLVPGSKTTGSWNWLLIPVNMWERDLRNIATYKNKCTRQQNNSTQQTTAVMSTIGPSQLVRNQGTVRFLMISMEICPFSPYTPSWHGTKAKGFIYFRFLNSRRRGRSFTQVVSKCGIAFRDPVFSTSITFLFILTRLVLDYQPYNCAGENNNDVFFKYSNASRTFPNRRYTL